jgi:predicted 3-demethylubiquinone-9 3-methyltransferase (glyoxalase superfamily)
MKTMKTMIYTFAFLLMGTSICLAQDSDAPAKPNDQPAGFEWLKQFEGTWRTNYNGTMKSEVLGGLWVVNELSVMNVKAIQSISYDAEKKQFTGSWIDSSSNFIWNYTGSLDESGNKLVLEAEGPDPSDPKKIRRYRDIYEFRSRDEIAAESQMLNDEGQWTTSDSGTMKRLAESEPAPESETKALPESTVTPFLMFTGKAEAAIEFYKTVFADLQVESMNKYKAGESGKEGTVQLATFVIQGQRVKCIDSPPVHDFDFTPSFSFFVECENEGQLKERFAKLSEEGKVMMPLDNYGFSQQFGWVSDKFGVSWQLNLK